MKITIEKLEELGACKSGTDWFRDTHPEGIEHDELVRHLMAERSDWAYWLISKLLTPEKNAVWADYSATIAADDADAYASASARYADDAARHAAAAARHAAAAARYADDAAARYAARYAAFAADAAAASRYAAAADADAGDKARALVIKKGLDLIKEQK